MKLRRRQHRVGRFVVYGACALSALVAAPATPVAVGRTPETPALSDSQRALVKEAEAARVAAIAKVYGTVVSLFGNDRQGGGSGVLFDPAGLALTNHHVVAAAGGEGWAGLSDGRLYRWRLIGTDPGGDIALVQLEGKQPFPCAALGDSDRVRVGDWAMAMGNPFVLAEHYDPTVTLGIVSGVGRYQPGGGGKNQLIYGNCIQVDSSINPGNSGGPLFNSASQVIGINGRGSFKERGRVNVGLGYAVSTNQIRNFLPDLLATKIAQHGTLEALFTNRDGHVICSTINLDAPAARAGLQLGDEMVSFEGHRVGDANSLANLITTLPAGWPVRLDSRRDGKDFKVVVRLSPLPYTLAEADTPEGEPGRGAGPKPKKPSQPPGIAPPAEKRLDLSKAGQIRHSKINQQNAVRLLEQWQGTTGIKQLPADIKAFHFVNEFQSPDKSNRPGMHELVLCRDGRFRSDVISDGGHLTIAFDGEKFWWRSGKPPAKLVSLQEATWQSFCAESLAFAAALNPQILKKLGTMTLDGSDRIGDRPAYRLRLADKDDTVLYLWLSVDVEGDVCKHDLLAVGPQIDPAKFDTLIEFGTPKAVGNQVKLPREWTGLTFDWRAVEFEVVPKTCELLKSIDPEIFQPKTNEKP